jgi:hypothetical protein
MSTRRGPGEYRSAAERERQQGTTAVRGGFREDRLEMVLDSVFRQEHPPRDFRLWVELESPGP